jgi:carboxyl-terminal processing protease
MKKTWILLPLMLATALAAGIYIGADLASLNTENRLFKRAYHESTNKISQIINFIERQYVDSVDRAEIIDKGIQQMLQNLDPHSYYISASELRQHTEPLEGNFDGIGVEFTIQNDTVFVVTPLEGGPSEALGILSGDRIVTVNDENIAGIGITNRDVMEKLRGVSGTKVTVQIKRRNQNELLDFTITRGKIPIYSVAVSYLLNENTGYIKVTRFAKTTYDEFMSGVQGLQQKGMKQLIIDLRGNGGGYLNTAIAMCEELFKGGTLLVYTEGKSQPRKTYTTNRNGSLTGLPVVVLIDQGSASASEILAGAVQDNDRGIVVGRRSFGKGLVQEHYEFPDSSAIRLTVARYYTPSGRSIQRPYGEGINYEADFYARYENGELYDSTKIEFPDSISYKTLGGRTVYGGGGIVPDIFVPLDTAGGSAYLSSLSYSGILNEFAFDYADKNRQVLSSEYTSESFKQQFEVTRALLNSLYQYAEEKDLKRNDQDIARSGKFISIRLKALIGRNIWGNDVYYPVISEDDNALQEALKAFTARSSILP